MLNSAGYLHHQHPTPLFDCLCCETNNNHITEECPNLQHPKEKHKANCTQSKASTNKGKPQPAKPAGATPAEFAGEASRILFSSDLTITNPNWNPGTGAMHHIMLHKWWLTHYKTHHVPVQLGDNSIIWSEGIGVCWVESVLEGHPEPLAQFSNILYVPCLASNLLSLFSLTMWGYTFTGTGHCLSFSKDGQVFFQSQGTASASICVTLYLCFMRPILTILLLLLSITDDFTHSCWLKLTASDQARKQNE